MKVLYLRVFSLWKSVSSLFLVNKAVGEKRGLKIIGAADGGGAVAKVLACHVVEAAFKRPVLTQILIYSHFGIEISRGIGIAAAARAPDDVGSEAPAIG